MALRELAFKPGQYFADTAPVFAPLRVPPQRHTMLIDPSGRVLRTPLLLDIQRMDDGRWLATHPEVMTHGVGDTPNAAARDFQSMLVDLFIELVESETVLATHLQRELEYLRGILVESNLT